jgi:threonine/homoserine/homoserine lactone efflux protein
MGFDIVGYLIFAFVTSITLGPNNYLLFSYGKNFGFKDSNKLMLGIALGFVTMLLISGYGLGEIIKRNPTVGFILKIISSVWLLYLAFILSKLSADISADSKPKVGFYQAYFLQFVNPKAWIMAITGASAFLPHMGNIHLSVWVFALSFGLVGVPCMITWISFGDLISKVLKSEKANRNLGYLLFFLMIVSILMIWIKE